MNRESVSTDGELLERLGRIVSKVDPVPARVSDFARAAYSFRGLDAELALLVCDSAQELAALRGPVQDRRLLEFAAGDIEIDVEVSVVGEHRSLIGELRSTREVEDAIVVLEASSGAHTSEIRVDRQGRFSFASLPPGSIRLLCLCPGASRVVTPWITSSSSSAI